MVIHKKNPSTSNVKNPLSHSHPTQSSYHGGGLDLSSLKLKENGSQQKSEISVNSLPKITEKTLRGSVNSQNEVLISKRETFHGKTFVKTLENSFDAGFKNSQDKSNHDSSRNNPKLVSKSTEHKGFADYCFHMNGQNDSLDLSKIKKTTSVIKDIESSNQMDKATRGIGFFSVPKSKSNLHFQELTNKNHGNIVTENVSFENNLVHEQVLAQEREEEFKRTTQNFQFFSKPSPDYAKNNQRNLASLKPIQERIINNPNNRDLHLSRLQRLETTGELETPLKSKTFMQFQRKPLQKPLPQKELSHQEEIAKMIIESKILKPGTLEPEATVSLLQVIKPGNIKDPLTNLFRNVNLEFSLDTIFSPKEISMQFERFKLENKTLNMRDLTLSTYQRESKLLQLFFYSIHERIKHEIVDKEKQVKLLEIVTTFSTRKYAEIMRPYLKDTHEMLYAIISAEEDLRSRMEVLSESKIDLLMTQYQDASGPFSKVKDKLRREIELEEKVSSLTGTVHNLTEELKSLRDSFDDKEKKMYNLMNKVQTKCGLLKNAYHGMLEYYNNKCSYINRFKQKLIVSMAIKDPSNELLQEEEFMTKAFCKEKWGIEEISDDEDEVNDVFKDRIEKIIQENNQPEQNSQDSENNKDNLKRANSQDSTYSPLNELKSEIEASKNRKILFSRSYFNIKSHSSRNIKILQKLDKQGGGSLFSNSIIKLDKATDTNGLVTVKNDVISQTTISLASKKYKDFLNNQYDVDVLHKRLQFENAVNSKVNHSTFMSFVTDDIIRCALGLDTSRPIETLQVKDSELIRNVEELKRELQTLSKEEYEEECIRRGFEDYFNLANIDTYFDLKCKVALPFTETTMKYIFMSYIYSAYALKKSRELVRRREEQVAVLFRFFRQLKQRLKKVEGEYRKKKTEMDVLTDLHANCKVSQLAREFTIEQTALEEELAAGPTSFSMIPDKETGGAFNAGSSNNLPNHGAIIDSLMRKVHKIKAISKVKNKKYFSFKIIYQKLQQFFALRSQEAKLTDSQKVEHAYGLEEHFFRLLTEKDVGVKKIEERIKNFVVTLLNTEPNPKIKIFMRFINLDEQYRYGAIEEFLYLKGIDFIRTESRGLEITPDLQKGNNFVAVEKFEAFFQRYIISRLQAKVANTLIKDLKNMYIITAEICGQLFKKGVVDYDQAMEEVFKWIHSKADLHLLLEDLMLLFVVLDLHGSGRLSFGQFVSLYKLLNVEYYEEATKYIFKSSILPAVDPEPGTEDRTGEEKMEMQHSLNFDTFANTLGVLPQCAENTEPENYQPEYIHSDGELKEMFCRYTQCENKQGEVPQTSLDFVSFMGIVNEYENIFNMGKIYRMLGTSSQKLENDYLYWRESFETNYEQLNVFIQYCMIADSQWKSNQLRLVKRLKDQFFNQKSLDETKSGLKSRIQHEGLNYEMLEPRLDHSLHLRTLFQLRLLLIDLMRVDFEQRIDHIDCNELPFIDN